MARKLLGVACALCSTVLLTGCPAEPLERLGAFDAMDELMEDLLPDPEQNPAVRELPDLKDPALEAAQGRLVARQAAFRTDRERLLSSDGALACPLTRDLQWRVAKGMTEADFARTYATMETSLGPQVTHLEAVLLEGDCSDGRPEGRFVAVGRSEIVQKAGTTMTTSIERRRVEGTLVDGRLEGELLSSARIDNSSARQGALFSHDFHGLELYRDGEPRGSALHMQDGTGADGSLASLTTTVVRVVGPGTQQVTSYVGGMLQSESTLVDGQLHGWLQLYDVQYVKDYTFEGEPRRTCYQHGREAPESACGHGS